MPTRRKNSGIKFRRNKIQIGGDVKQEEIDAVILAIDAITAKVVSLKKRIANENGISLEPIDAFNKLDENVFNEPTTNDSSNFSEFDTPRLPSTPAPAPPPLPSTSAPGPEQGPEQAPEQAPGPEIPAPSPAPGPEIPGPEQAPAPDSSSALAPSNKIDINNTYESLGIKDIMQGYGDTIKDLYGTINIKQQMLGTNINAIKSQFPGDYKDNQNYKESLAKRKMLDSLKTQLRAKQADREQFIQLLKDNIGTLQQGGRANHVGGKQTKKYQKKNNQKSNKRYDRKR